MERCRYANSRTQELSSLKELSVTSGNAAEIATKVLDITSNAQEVCEFVRLSVCVSVCMSVCVSVFVSVFVLFVCVRVLNRVSVCVWTHC